MEIGLCVVGFDVLFILYLLAFLLLLLGMYKVYKGEHHIFLGGNLKHDLFNDVKKCADILLLMAYGFDFFFFT